MKEGWQSWRASKRVTHAKFHLGKMGKKIGRTCLKHRQRISNHLQKRWMMCHWTCCLSRGQDQIDTPQSQAAKKPSIKDTIWIKLGAVSHFTNLEISWKFMEVPGLQLFDAFYRGRSWSSTATVEATVGSVHHDGVMAMCSMKFQTLLVLCHLKHWSCGCSCLAQVTKRTGQAFEVTWNDVSMGICLNFEGRVVG